MCGVFGQTRLDFSATDYVHHLPILLDSPIIAGKVPPAHNIWTGMYALVITADTPTQYEAQLFGLTPSWAKKKMYLFNARSEGKLNETNDTHYRHAAKAGIYEMPSFRGAVQYRRAVLPVDYFVEGTVKERLNEPFVVRRQDKNPLLLGIIWEEWADATTGELLRAFSIITTPATALLQSLPHHRSPLVIEPKMLPLWLDKKASPAQITALLYAADSNEWEAKRVASTLKDRSNRPLIEMLH
ncbi:MAG: SOS response-associated peptidase family protein [Sphingobacteriales bacterium]|nr:SOS response-associated peptidase family protein [Sphingobacteriales bacterium]